MQPVPTARAGAMPAPARALPKISQPMLGEKGDRNCAARNTGRQMNSTVLRPSRSEMGDIMNGNTPLNTGNIWMHTMASRGLDP